MELIHRKNRIILLITDDMLIRPSSKHVTNGLEAKMQALFAKEQVSAPNKSRKHVNIKTNRNNRKHKQLILPIKTISHNEIGEIVKIFQSKVTRLAKGILTK